MTIDTPDPDPAPADSSDDLLSLVLRIARYPPAERDAAIESFCQANPNEDARALRAAVASALDDRSLGERGTTCPDPTQQLDKLKSLSPPSGRYQLVGEVARGGMGVILRVLDKSLGRPLAMKVILGPGDDAGGQTPPVAQEALARFLDEAQVTGQLDHPGVVPVHELGLDADGRVYFTMRLVKGRTAQEVFGLGRTHSDGWTLTKALEVMLKICDTLAYAHEKGVVHRDLKPANVMVGQFGEVYVMDWGLAKVLGREDWRDLRPWEGVPASAVRTDRSREAESNPDSPLVTMDGTVVGTPSYMSPEQAEGRVQDVDARSDVYSAGACLYTLLTGWQPYLRPGARASAYSILHAVREGPPRSIHEIDPTIPAELVAICDRAMARDRAARYATMGELAEDLRAFLGDRVVKAHRTGAWAELRAWTRRNRVLAAVIVVAVLGVSLGVGLAWRQALIARDRAEDALAALSLPALADRGAHVDHPALGTVRYRRPQNISMFGGAILEVCYAGPRTRIAFVNRNWKGADLQSETTLFEFPYGALEATPAGTTWGDPFSSKHQVYTLQLVRPDGGDDHVLSLRYLDPHWLKTAGASYGENAARVDWQSGGCSIHIDFEPKEIPDDQDIQVMDGGYTGPEQLRSEVVVRFRD